jgi:hypothetical protein
MEAQIELAKAKAEGAQLAISQLQVELLGQLREVVGDQAVRKPVVITIAELNSVLATTPLPSETAARLIAARDQLTQLLTTSAQAESTLANLEAAARRGGELRADLAHDVAEERAALGGLYAEFAADAAKAGDLGRARRLLAAAAHLDPGNRARYEAQLRSFDRAASLPRADGAADASGQGDQR